MMESLTSVLSLTIKIKIIIIIIKRASHPLRTMANQRRCLKI